MSARRVGVTRSRPRRFGVGAFLVLLHVPPVVAMARGPQPRDWLAFAVLALIISFGFTGGLHRYFAHRSFKTSRPFQLALALAASVGFGDAIGFSGKHRLHHQFADTGRDVHSPRQGLFSCWFGSLIDEGYSEEALLRRVPDLLRYPELRWLHGFFWMPAIAVAGLTWWVGGFSMFAFGYCLAVLWGIHVSSAVNWFGHRRTHRAYATADDSGNSWLLAIVSLGEGWHNNHHYYPAACRAGFHWWQWDPTYYTLRLLSWLGLIWDLREVPEQIRKGMAPARPLHSKRSESGEATHPVVVD